MNKYDRSWAEEQEKQEERLIMNSFKWFAALMGCIVLCSILLTECTTQTTKLAAPASETKLTAEQEEYKNFFKAHGSPAPEKMAIAVTATKRPALMAAIAVVESNGDPKAVGDKGESRGAFQVQEKHWGKVPTTAVEQALQAERILEELLSSRRSLRSRDSRLRMALASYNGGTRPPRAAYRYADKVMRIKP